MSNIIQLEEVKTRFEQAIDNTETSRANSSEKDDPILERDSSREHLVLAKVQTTKLKSKHAPIKQQSSNAILKNFPS
jgi:hypothetical protein